VVLLMLECCGALCMHVVVVYFPLS